jgi:hypothetical protein
MIQGQTGYSLGGPPVGHHSAAILIRVSIYGFERRGASLSLGSEGMVRRSSFSGCLKRRHLILAVLLVLSVLAAFLFEGPGQMSTPGIVVAAALCFRMPGIWRTSLGRSSSASQSIPLFVSWCSGWDVLLVGGSGEKYESVKNKRTSFLSQAIVALRRNSFSIDCAMRSCAHRRQPAC